MENGQEQQPQQETNKTVLDLINNITNSTPVTENNDNIVEENTVENDEVVEVPVQETTPAVENIEEPLIVLPESEVEQTQTTTSIPDLSDIFGSELKTKDEIKQYVESLKTKAESAEKENETIFANDTVKALNEYLKKGGGDEREFLDAKSAQKKTESLIDYINKSNPIEIYKQDLMLPLEEGGLGLTADEVEEHIFTKTELELKIEGNKAKIKHLGFQQEILNNQKQQEVDMVRNVEAKSQMFKEKIQSYVNELKDVDGIQVSDTDKKALSKILANPTAYLKTAFPLDANGLPTKDWAVNAMRLHNNKRIISELKNKVSNAKTSGAKEVFNALHNIPNNEASSVKNQQVAENNDGELVLKAIKQGSKSNHYN